MNVTHSRSVSSSAVILFVCARMCVFFLSQWIRCSVSIYQGHVLLHICCVEAAETRCKTWAQTSEQVKVSLVHNVHLQHTPF